MRIYIDFKSPGAYLALGPSLALISKHRVQAEWRPFNSRQTAIPAVQENEDVGARHRRIRATAQQDTHLLYAKLQNVPMSFAQHPGDTTLALATLQALNTQQLQESFIQAAFQAYWVAHSDLNRAAVVAELLTASGGDPDMLADLDSSTLLQQARSQAEDDGVIDAPAYVVGEQLFIGREHLPWVEAIVSAKS